MLIDLGKYHNIYCTVCKKSFSCVEMHDHSTGGVCKPPRETKTKCCIIN